MQIRSDPLLLEFFHEFDQVLQAAADAGDQPGGGDHVELARASGHCEPLERRTLLAALEAADAVIDVLLDDLPASLLSDPQEILPVLDRPAGCGNLSSPHVLRTLWILQTTRTL
jgi:hypothetical protein